MHRPFTVIAVLLMLVVAAAHVYRAYAGIDITIAGHPVPMMASYIAAVVFGVIGLFGLFELRR